MTLTPDQHPGVAGAEWTPNEVALVVADYFAMLTEEMAGRPYVKKARNRGIQSVIGCSAGSIEFKHQNISAVLAELGLPWTRGYKPRFNYQNELVEEIGRHLPSLARLPEVPILRAPDEIAVDPFVAPPIRRNGQPQPVLERLVRLFDPAERDRRNRALGLAGEEFVIEVEERRLHRFGGRDFASRLKWISRDEGDGAGYDIRSVDIDTGRDMLIEVKTTRGGQMAPFYLTRNDEALSRERPADFHLYRVFSFGNATRIFSLRPPLDRAVHLMPATWSASFNRRV